MGGRKLVPSGRRWDLWQVVVDNLGVSEKGAGKLVS